MFDNSSHVFCVIMVVSLFLNEAYYVMVLDLHVMCMILF